MVTEDSVLCDTLKVVNYHSWAVRGGITFSTDSRRDWQLSVAFSEINYETITTRNH